MHKFDFHELISLRPLSLTTREDVASLVMSRLVVVQQDLDMAINAFDPMADVNYQTADSVALDEINRKKAEVVRWEKALDWVKAAL